MHILEPESGARLMREVLEEMGASQSAAAHVSTSLVQTSLRGTDSHGVRLFPHYTRALQAGRINVAPKLSLNHHGTTTATLNSDAAFGHEAGSVAMQKACDFAEEHGTGMVTVRNSTHLGAAAYFGLQAAERGMIGFAFTNADSLVKVPGSSLPFFGTNPVCFCAPMAIEGPFCLDMATSTIAWNKLLSFSDGNIPVGLAFDIEGKPANHPGEAASLAPAGDYKGFGLGMMVSVLCSILGDGPFDADIPPMFRSPLDQRRGITHCFMAVRIASFLPLQSFKTRLQTLAERVRALPAVDGQKPMIPGDPEKSMQLVRARSGIPISRELREEFISVSKRLGNAIA